MDKLIIRAETQDQLGIEKLKNPESKALESQVERRLALVFSQENRSEVHLEALMKIWYKRFENTLKAFERDALRLKMKADWEREYPVRKMIRKFFNCGWEPLTEESANQMLTLSLKQIDNALNEIKNKLWQSIQIEESKW